MNIRTPTQADLRAVQFGRRFWLSTGGVEPLAVVSGGGCWKWDSGCTGRVSTGRKCICSVCTESGMATCSLMRLMRSETEMAFVVDAITDSPVVGARERVGACHL